jgi:hypothetical protein
MLQYAIQRRDSHGATFLVDAFEAMDDRDAMRVARLTFERLAQDDLELVQRDRVVKRRRELPRA